VSDQMQNHGDVSHVGDVAERSKELGEEERLHAKWSRHTMLTSGGCERKDGPCGVNST
jgi:hypothetical protein